MMTRTGPSERLGEIDRLQRNPNVNLVVTSRVVPCVTVSPLNGSPVQGSPGRKDGYRPFLRCAV